MNEKQKKKQDKIVTGSGYDFLKLFWSKIKSYPAPGMIF